MFLDMEVTTRFACTGRRFAFEAACWQGCVSECVQLARVFRQARPALCALELLAARHARPCLLTHDLAAQADRDFVDILAAVRSGSASLDTLNSLRERCSRPLQLDDGILPTMVANHEALSQACTTHGRPIACAPAVLVSSSTGGKRMRCAAQLYTHCEDVEAVNGEQLQRLPGGPLPFSAHDTGSSDLLDSACPVASFLTIPVVSLASTPAAPPASRSIVKHQQ